MMPITQLCLSVAFLGASPTTVVLDFTASWCGPCQQMSPIVAKLERQGLPIRSIDVDQHQDLARRYRIENIPTFVLVIDGAEVERHVGQVSEATLRRMTAQAMPQPEPNREQKKFFEKPRIPVPFLVRNSLHSASKSEQAPVIRAKYEVPDNLTTQTTSDFDLSCCVRIRVKDSGGVNFGSGTIIASQPGRSIIVTCGHIFRSSSRDSRIDVDVFNNGRVETFPGELLRHDLEADVGILTIPSVVQLSTATVAPMETPLREGNPVLSMGCSAGDAPSKQSLRITALNRYLGPDNVECTGVPIQGRSGGGLFNADGKVIGVCIAADPRDQRGLYAGLKPIQTLLQRCGLAHLYEKQLDALEDKPLLADAAANPNLPELNRLPLLLTAAGRSQNEFTASDSPAYEQIPLNTQPNVVEYATTGESFQETAQTQPIGDVAFPMPTDRANAMNERQTIADDSNRSPENFGSLQSSSHSDSVRKIVTVRGTNIFSAGASGDQAHFSATPFSTEHANTRRKMSQTPTSERLRKVFEQVGEAEVVCIIRSLDNPRVASHVVIINRASARFVADLVGEVQAQTRPTSLTVPWTGVSRQRSEDSAGLATATTDATLIPASLHATPHRYHRSQASRRFH